jgi:hypothetical protein
MSQPREPQAPTPELNPDSTSETEQAPLAEPLFSGTLTPDTTTHPSIKNN